MRSFWYKTFFPGFPGGYHVFALDPGYRWAMISGPNRGYLWILAREPRMDDATYQRLVGMAADKGFAVEGLIKDDWEHLTVPKRRADLATARLRLIT